MVDAITQTAAAAGQSNSATSTEKFNEDYTSFLTLLTTQLQNQDPTSPMDSSEFTNQLVQFTSVEQQMQTNRNLEDLTTIMMGSMNSDATSYLGKDAVINGGMGQLQNGKMDWTYTMPPGVVNAGVAVFDEEGNQVASLTADKTFGNHSLTWDGKDSDGNPVADGKYRMQVLAFDQNNEGLSVPVQTKQRITEISMAGLESMFTAGGMDFNKSDILKLVLAN